MSDIYDVDVIKITYYKSTMNFTAWHVVATIYSRDLQVVVVGARRTVRCHQTKMSPTQFLVGHNPDQLQDLLAVRHC